MAGELIGAIILWLIAAILLIALIVWLLNWLYHRSSKEMSFVRTGFGGERVVINSGALVLPIVHEITPVSMNVNRLRLALKKEKALITSDRMRVDIEADFFVRVMPSRDGVSMAAATLGSRTMEPDLLSELLEGKFVGALRSVAAEMSLDNMHEKRSEYVARVTKYAADMLTRNGLELESVAITNLDQTDLEYFNPANRFDAEGLTQLIGNIEERRKLRNDIEQTSLVSIRARNLLAEKETLEIDRQSAAAKLEQEREIEAIRASQKAEIAQTRTKFEAEATAASIASKRAIEEARIHLERDTKRLEVERSQDVELAEIEKQILVLKKEVEASSVRVANEEARTKVAAAQEGVVTSRESEVARRTAAIGRMNAEKDADIVKIASESEKVRALVAAESKRLLNEAENVLSDDARTTRFREKLLDRLEGIVRESVRPLEKIEGIKIVQMGGFGGGNQGEAHRSPTDEVIESALRFRAQAPLIDEMMKEIGVENSGVAKMGDIFRSARDANSLAREAETNKKKKDQA